MAKEVVQEEIIGRLLGAVVVASIHHGAHGRRLLHVVIVNHRHFPQTFMLIFRAWRDFASLVRFEVERVRPHGRVALSWRGGVEKGKEKNDLTPVKKSSSLTMLILFKAAPRRIELQKRA